MTKHFFIIGAQRCGTTWLSKTLDLHPEIVMATPISPEPKYFLQANDPLDDLEVYIQRFFPNVSDGLICGEKSTSYIEFESAASSICKLIPEAKIIVVLREPKSRAISNYQFSLDSGLEKRDINEAFINEEQTVASYKNPDLSVCPFAYLARGKYVNYLSKYLQYFPKNQIKVILFENLICNQSSYSSILNFLGVPKEDADLDHVVNQSCSRMPNLNHSTCEKLNSHFVETNRKLADMFDLDLTVWNTSDLNSRVV
tara:strand:- start:4668 stop:5435 length:768 start_codon:yes stop_codon:yes gene_type:complete